MASWTTINPVGTLVIGQTGPFVTLRFQGTTHIRFFLWNTVQGGVDNDIFWLYVISPRDTIRDAFPFANEMQFQIDTAVNTAAQVANDFGAQVLLAKNA